jgi:hypothetical protein
MIGGTAAKPLDGWEFWRNLLTRHARFVPQLGKKRRDFNVALGTLTPLI